MVACVSMASMEVPRLHLDARRCDRGDRRGRARGRPWAGDRAGRVRSLPRGPGRRGRAAAGSLSRVRRRWRDRRRGRRSCRTTRWTTSPSRWMRPRTAIMLADMMVRRFCSKTFGQTTRLAMPVSSSSVMNSTPLAEPGRWRTSTIPAASSDRPSRAPMASAQVTIRRRRRSSRRKATGCCLSDSPRWR